MSVVLLLCKAMQAQSIHCGVIQGHDVKLKLCAYVNVVEYGPHDACIVLPRR